MSSLPDYYASPIHLPFNRACLAEQFILQAPGADPGGPGYGVLLCGSRMSVVKDQGRFLLPYGEWLDKQMLYLGLWQGKPCRLIKFDGANDLPKDLENDRPTRLQSRETRPYFLPMWLALVCFCKVLF